MNGDLHIHTNVSDGEQSPAAVAKGVLASSMGFFSVTDHNSLAGLHPVADALPDEGVGFIYGVELSAQPKDGEELHLLGYGVDPDSAELNEACRLINRKKHEQFHEMVARLRGDGVDVDVEDVAAGADGSYVGRPVLAGLLVKKGIVQTLREAFNRYLGRGAVAHVQMGHFSPSRCIQAIHQAGGLEAFRPALTGNDQLYVEKVAEHFDLFVTGGSDWHGRDGEPPLGAFAVKESQLKGFFDALASREGSGVRRPDSSGRAAGRQSAPPPGEA
jgi:predicted metal-dependent phosphoesterase TrpH